MHTCPDNLFHGKFSKTSFSFLWCFTENKFVQWHVSYLYHPMTSLFLVALIQLIAWPCLNSLEWASKSGKHVCEDLVLLYCFSLYIKGFCPYTDLRSHHLPQVPEYLFIGWLKIFSRLLIYVFINLISISCRTQDHYNYGRRKVAGRAWALTVAFHRLLADFHKGFPSGATLVKDLGVMAMCWCKNPRITTSPVFPLWLRKSLGGGAPNWTISLQNVNWCERYGK